MSQRVHNAFFWALFLVLTIGTVTGLANRLISGKRILPLYGLIVGSGGAFLMLVNVAIDDHEASEYEEWD